MDLNTVILLYRKSGRPAFNGSSFTSEIDFHKNKKLVLSLYKNRSNLGRFNDLEIDDYEIFRAEDFPEHGSSIKYTFNVNQGSAEKFYSNKEEFITINSLKRGEMPNIYYIVEDDFSPSDKKKPDYIVVLESICHLIKTLSEIAHFNDIKNDSNGSFYKLVFILNSESKSSSAVIETKISESILNIQIPDTSIIESLSNESSESDPHYIEKINTFRNTLIEYINNNSSDFNSILRNWNEINSLYVNNLSIYMSSFSFHKSRKEVSEAELEYAEKISKVISDISTKALAIPVSTIASVAVFQSNGKPEAFIAFSSILLTSLITSFLCISQINQLNRIIHSKDTLFSGMKEKLSNMQSEIEKRLDDTNLNLIKNENFCRNILELTLSIAWAPTFIGAIGLLLKFI